MIESPFTAVADIGEFGLIDRMKALLGPAKSEDVLISIGDDAAVVRLDENRVQVITTDALIEGIHFNRSFMPLGHLGAKAIAVNVSDVVAMNAQPRFATVALGLPHNVSVEMVEALYEGFAKACNAYGVTLLGGDTTAARSMTISITLIGEGHPDQIALRNGAKPGDKLCVTGDLGASYAGLRMLLDQQNAMAADGADGVASRLDAFPYIIQRHLVPTARLSIIRNWQANSLRPTAMIDISDGLASEVQHICRQSGCGARIDAAQLPIHEETRKAAAALGQDADTYALYGGEDYELLFTIPADQEDAFKHEKITVIGECLPESDGLTVQTPEGARIPLEGRGYQHFGGGGTV